MFARLLEKSLVAAIAAVLLGSQAVQACIVPSPRGYEYFADAQVIVRAKLRSYDVVRYIENSPETVRQLAQRGIAVEPRVPTEARIELEVVETIAGLPRRSSWQAYQWVRDETWSGPSEVIVGLSARMDADGSAKIVVINQACGGPGLLDHNAANVQAVLAAVAERRERDQQEFRRRFRLRFSQ